MRPAPEEGVVLQLLQAFERADGGADRFGGDMRLTGGGTELGVTQQNLDDPHIRPRLKQMRREAMAERVRGRGLVDPGHMFRGGERPVELPR